MKKIIKDSTWSVANGDYYTMQEKLVARQNVVIPEALDKAAEFHLSHIAVKEYDALKEDWRAGVLDLSFSLHRAFISLTEEQSDCDGTVSLFNV